MIANLSDCPWFIIFLLIGLPWAVMMWLGFKVAGWLDGRDRRAMAARLAAIRAKSLLTK